MNQLGGVGAVSGGNNSRMFGATSDGVKDCVTGSGGCVQIVKEAYLEAFGREPDASGLRTYCIAISIRRWSKADVIADLKKNGDSLAELNAKVIEGKDLDQVLPELIVGAKLQGRAKCSNHLYYNYCRQGYYGCCCSNWWYPCRWYDDPKRSHCLCLCEGGGDPDHCFCKAWKGEGCSTT